MAIKRQTFFFCFVFLSRSIGRGLKTELSPHKFGRAELPSRMMSIQLRVALSEEPSSISSCLHNRHALSPVTELRRWLKTRERTESRLQWPTYTRTHTKMRREPLRNMHSRRRCYGSPRTQPGRPWCFASCGSV